MNVIHIRQKTMKKTAEYAMDDVQELMSTDDILSDDEKQILTDKIT